MIADPTLLQMKYTRVIERFAEKADISLRDTMDFFYHSKVRMMLQDGVSNLHCMSDGYIAQDLLEEYQQQKEMT